MYSIIAQGCGNNGNGDAYTDPRGGSVLLAGNHRTLLVRIVVLAEVWGLLSRAGHVVVIFGMPSAAWVVGDTGSRVRCRVTGSGRVTVSHAMLTSEVPLSGVEVCELCTWYQFVLHSFAQFTHIGPRMMRRDDQLPL